MGSFVGNDQNTLLYDFMQKIQKTETVTYATEAQ